MFLAHSLNLYYDELFCDLAEYYHVFDMKALPPVTVARLLFGLRGESRLMMAYSGMKYSLQELLLAQCSDALNLLWWKETTDAQANRNRPESVASLLVGKQKKTNGNSSFNSPEEFERARALIINRK